MLFPLLAHMTRLELRELHEALFSRRLIQLAYVIARYTGIPTISYARLTRSLYSSHLDVDGIACGLVSL